MIKGGLYCFECELRMEAKDGLKCAVSGEFVPTEERCKLENKKLFIILAEINGEIQVRLMEDK